MNDIIKDIFNNEKEKIYFSHNLINLDVFQKYEEELIELNIYLPNLLRQIVNYDYYGVLLKNDNLDNVFKQIEETKNYTMEQSTQELLDWIKIYPQFQKIINDNNLKELNNDLRELNDKFN